ncbi:hypothetical protein HNR46_000502 [Haloferula luteola]|uniref:Phosphate-selective porin O and P n=1 Tax=Haloferula luteola TaxID=595692 RepID=A0A840V667_9BACT|nr:porin [Haloferula luteola]MBB5350278.1 hypothetical protein [Haloferula luteola]
MKLPIISVWAVASLATASANDALDILEGNKKVDEVALPPLPEGADDPAAEDKPVVFQEKTWSPSPLDPIWSRAVLYENPDDPWIQQLAVMGFFEFRGAWGEAEVAGKKVVDVDTTRTRRARLGARMKIFGHTEIEAVGEFAGDDEYQRLERLKGKTQLPKGLAVEYGKFRPHFGIEGSKEPQQMLTPNRALLTSMLMPAETLGVSFSQDNEHWDWSLGWFSGDRDRAIPGFEGNGFIAASIAYQGDERMEDGEAMRVRWHLDYINNMDHRKSESVPRYSVAGQTARNGFQGPISNPAFRHLVSTGFSAEGERFGVEGDFMLANGDLNAWGMTLTPSYWILPERLQVVGRYHYADTDTAGGLVGGLGVNDDPLFDSTPLYVGDEFHSFYLGTNLYLYQDKVVIMNGLEYASMKDQSGLGFDTEGWIWHSGARISF